VRGASAGAEAAEASGSRTLGDESDMRGSSGELLCDVEELLPGPLFMSGGRRCLGSPDSAQPS
jgi:hypothetical protein